MTVPASLSPWRTELGRGAAALLLVAWVQMMAGCAPMSMAPPPQAGLWQDSAFSAPSQPVRAQDALALSHAMRHYLDSQLRQGIKKSGPQRALVEALYESGQLKVEYDSTRTRNAAEAFDARAGNCLSLVLMTGALANHLGLPVRYQSAFVDESWSRFGDLYFRSGHVNVSFGRRLADASRRLDMVNVTIDFLPPEQAASLRTIELREDTVVAMYLNNRAAEVLASGQPDEAYWWVKAAIQHAPDFLAAYNTLGVVYQRKHLHAAAEQAFAAVLAAQPEHTQALFNLSRLWALAGRTQEAQALEERLARLEPHPPYHYFDQGRSAMARGDWAAARDWFAKELARAPHHSEFHFWLSQAEYRLGHWRSAGEHLQQAKEHSTGANERALYAAKLEWLKQQTRLR